MNTTTTTIFIDSVVCSDELANKLQTDENVWRLTSSKQNPDLASNARFPAFGCVWHGDIYSRAWHRLHVSPRLASITFFFPRLAPVASFPALDIGSMFCRAWHSLNVFPLSAPGAGFPRLEPVACFPALGIGSMFRRACHPLYVFLPFAPLTGCLLSLGRSDWFTALFLFIVIGQMWYI